MVRVQAGTVKIQPRKAGGFMLTLPISIARGLGLNDNVKFEVSVDYEKREVVYKLKE